MKKLLSILFLVLTLPIFGQVASWEFVESQSVSSQDMQTTPVEFINLLSDSFDYRLISIMDGVAGNDTLIARFNGDSSTNYRQYRMTGAGASASGAISDSATSIPIVFAGNSLTSYRFLSIYELTGSSGNERILKGVNSGGNTSTTYIQERVGYWKNTADEINTLEISSTATTSLTCEFYLFKRPKSGVYQAEDWKIVDKWDSSVVDESTVNNTDLQAYWKLTEDLTDSKGSIDGTAGGDAQIIDGVLDLDGTGDFVNFGDSLDSITSGANAQWSASCWFKKDAGAGQYTLIAKQQLSSGGYGWAFTVYLSKFYFQWFGDLSGTSQRDYDSSTTFSTDTWYHGVVTYDGTQALGSRVKLYVNGSDDSASVAFSNGTPSAIPDNSARLAIGAFLDSDDSTNGVNWPGSIGRTRMYDKVLTSQEVSDIYNAEKEYYLGRDFNTDDLDFLVQGDDKDYRFDIEVDSTSAADARIYINDDTTQTNYEYQYFTNQAGTLGGNSGANLAPYLLFGEESVNRVLIKAKTGQYRPIFTSSAGITSSNSEQFEGGWQWNNSADKINKFTVSATSSVSTFGKITLYERTGFQASINAHERLIEEYPISGDFSSGYTFKNIPPEENIIIKGVVNVDVSSLIPTMYMRFNGDSGSNYTQQRLRITGSTTSAFGTTTATEITGCFCENNKPGLWEFYIFPKTGKYRPVLSKAYSGASGSKYLELHSYWYNNTTDDIQDILFISSNSASITGKIQLYKIQLK